jgi:N-methylhydantoinase A
MTARSISVDIGGTFTDFVVRDGDGSVKSYKASTTPGHLADGIFNGLDLIAGRRGLPTRDLVAGLASFAFGTTVATNAILERKVARTGLICTEGFRDTLLIREGGKRDTYNVRVDYPEPYIPRSLTFPVRERINAEGGVETPLDEADVLSAIAAMRDRGIEAVAVSLLWSIANPVHEKRIGAILASVWPEIPFSLGHKVNPTIREYRRTSAVAIDASLKPVVARSLDEIEARLAAQDFAGTLTVITSNGGRTALPEVLAKPVHLCLSGPSAISQAAVDVARAEIPGPGNVIAVDMGGTSFDISITSNWVTPLHREGTIGPEHFGVPSVEIVTIGAGGGSIARVDAGGFIHVGPESAGAMPGPACYGRGGTLPTVTDANLVRGLLRPDGFADGQMHLSRAAAEAALRDHVAGPLGLGLGEAASLVCLTAEQAMVAAMEEITIRRGIDPREYVLLAGGSACGLHAATMARELGMRHVVVPGCAGVLSAFGIDRGEVQFTFARSLFTTSRDFAFEAVTAVLDELALEGRAYLTRMRVPEAAMRLSFSAEARYAGQVWQLTLPLPEAAFDGVAGLAATVEAFHRLHELHYAVRAEADTIEFTEWNVVARSISDQPPLMPAPPAASARIAAASEHRRVHLREVGGEIEIPVYTFATLGDAVVRGPALVEDALTVTLVPQDASAQASPMGGLHITLA